MAKKRSHKKNQKARALKRFLLQILILAVVVAACWFALTRLSTPSADPRPSVSPEDLVQLPDSTPGPESTPTPSPKPTQPPEPYPVENIMTPQGLEVPAAGDTISLGNLDTLVPWPGDGGRVLVMTGWGFIPERDANMTVIYLVVTSLTDESQAVYPVRITGNGQDIAASYEGQGENLDKARFECAIDVSQLPDDYYEVSMLLENGKTREHIALGPNAVFETSGGIAY